MHIVNLEHMIFTDADIDRACVRQLFLNEKCADNEGDGNGELKHHQAVSDASAFESGTQFSFEGFCRLECRQVQRRIASGSKSYEKYESCEGSEKVRIGKMRKEG